MQLNPLWDVGQKYGLGWMGQKYGVLMLKFCHHTLGGCQILFGSSFSVKVGRGGTKSLYRYICQIQREKYERITAG